MVLQKMFVKNFDPKHIRVSKEVTSEIARLKSDMMLPLPQKMDDICCRKDWLQIAHLNIHSLRAHLVDLQHDTRLHTAQIIALTETWLHPNVPKEQCQWDGYTMYRLDRKAHLAAGIAIYVISRSTLC